MSEILTAEHFLFTGQVTEEVFKVIPGEPHPNPDPLGSVLLPVHT